MIITASILPQPPPGYKLPRRTHGGQEYIVTGWFPSNTTNNAISSCYRAPALVLDFDLVDFYVWHKQLTLPRDQKDYASFIKQQKKNLYAMPVDRVRELWTLFQYHIDTHFQKLGIYPTIATISGWGIHALFWLPDGAGYQDDNEFNLQQCQALNERLVNKINTQAGYQSADAKVHDCGTRLLRELGTRNTKAGRAIQVRRLAALSSGEVLTLAELKQLQSACAPVVNLPFNAPRRKAAPSYTSKYKNEKLDFSSVRVSTGRKTINLQDLADLQSPGQKINIVCPFGGNSVGGAFVVGAATVSEQKLVSNNTCTVYTNQVSPGVTDLDTHSRTGRILSSWLNCYKILSTDTRLPKLWFDSFRHRRMIDDVKLEDRHYRKLKLQLVQLYGVTFPTTTLKEAVKLVCEENYMNQLTNWLEGLRWDPTQESLINTWLIRVTGCDDTMLNRAYGRCFLLACVARAMRPGCKVDTVLILRGAQGIRKSTLFKVLAGDDYFSDTYINIGKKDSFQQLHNAWIYEMAELDSFYRKDASQIKSFLTSTHDEYRPPYGEELQTVPRHTVIVGTTNESAPLKDDTGNRRFWLVDCPSKKFDLDWLAKNRTALWAEAMHHFKKGSDWWLTPSEEAAQEAFNAEYIPGNSAEHFLVYWLQQETTGMSSFDFRAGDVPAAFQDCEGKQVIRCPSPKVLSQLLLAQEGMSKSKQNGSIVYTFNKPQNWEGDNVPEPHPLKRARQAQAIREARTY